MDKYSDIDLFVIGKHSTLELQKQISKLQRDYSREINVISMDNNEFNRKQEKDSFLFTLQLFISIYYLKSCNTNINVVS